jgi:hypothetical protein
MFSSAGRVGLTADGIKKGQDDRLMPPDISKQIAVNPQIAPKYNSKSPIYISRKYGRNLNKSTLPKMNFDTNSSTNLFGVISKISDMFTQPVLYKQSEDLAGVEIKNEYEKKLSMHYIDSYKKWLKTIGQEQPSIESFSKYDELMTAAHEAGHVLEYFLIDPASWMVKASIKKSKNLDKAIGVSAEGYIASFKNPLLNLFPVTVKNEIKRNLAGDVGIMIAQNKKLKFEDFLSTNDYLMGARDIAGTDLHSAYKNAEKYTEPMYGLNSWIPENYTEQERERFIHDFLKECYEETYQDLYAHKDKHQALTKLLLEKESLYPNDIYSAASGKKQYLLGLFSSNRQWGKYLMSLIAHEMNSLAKLHENSPYEMHTIFG